MGFKFIFFSFTLLFLNYAHAACVPRNSLASNPNPHAPPNLKPKDPVAAQPTPDKSHSPGAENSSGLVGALLSGLPQASGNVNPEIKKICDATDYPDVCLATLGRYHGPTDIPSVLGIAIQAGFDFAKVAVNTAYKLSTQPDTPPDRASLFSDCKDSYDDASYNFQNAHDALPGKDVGTMNTMLSAAITDVGDCQDLFEGKDCPLTSFSDKLRKMASNCLAIISQMHLPP